MTTSQILKGLFVLSALTLVLPTYSAENQTSIKQLNAAEKNRRLKSVTVSYVVDATQTVSQHFAKRIRF